MTDERDPHDPADVDAVVEAAEVERAELERDAGLDRRARAERPRPAPNARGRAVDTPRRPRPEL